MRRKLLINILKLGAVWTLVISLVVGAALPGIAASDEVELQTGKMPPDVLKGNVISVDEDRFIIESGEGEEVTISVDGNTKYFKVRAPWEVASLARHQIAPKRTEARERVGEGPVSIKLRLLNIIPWLRKARVSQAPPPMQAPEPVEGEEEVNRKPASLKSRIMGKIPWLKRARVGQAPLGIQALPPPRMQAVKPVEEQEGIPKPGQGRLNWLHRFGVKASFDDIAVGDGVVVWLSPNEDASVAKLVVIKKAPVLQRISGTIGTISGNSITITVLDGDPVPLTYDENTTFILKGVTAVMPGQSVHAVYNSEDMVAKLVRVRLEAAD